MGRMAETSWEQSEFDGCLVLHLVGEVREKHPLAFIQRSSAVQLRVVSGFRVHIYHIGIHSIGV